MQQKDKKPLKPLILYKADASALSFLSIVHQFQQKQHQIFPKPVRNMILKQAEIMDENHQLNDKLYYILTNKQVQLFKCSYFDGFIQQELNITARDLAKTLPGDNEHVAIFVSKKDAESYARQHKQAYPNGNDIAAYDENPPVISTPVIAAVRPKTNGITTAILERTLQTQQGRQGLVQAAHLEIVSIMIPSNCAKQHLKELPYDANDNKGCTIF